jgi:hypothetical protein
MRRFLALLTVAFLVYTSAGCRHVGGACDCDHAINPSYHAGTTGGTRGCGCGAGVAPAGAEVPVPPPPAPLPVAR